MWLSSAQIVAFLLLSMETYCYAAEDYYKTLGLKDTASIPEVKKAFRTLAKTLHPDKNKEPGAEAKFRKVLEAYEVLSDEDKKREYDAMRRGGGGSRSGSNFNSFGRGTRARNFDFDFDELFKQFESDIWEQHEHQKEHFRSHFTSHFQQHSKHAGGFDAAGDMFHEFDGDANSLFGDMDAFFDLDVESFGSSNSRHHHRRSSTGGHQRRQCHTVKQKIGNTVTTYTQCS